MKDLKESLDKLEPKRRVWQKPRVAKSMDRVDKGVPGRLFL